MLNMLSSYIFKFLMILNKLFLISYPPPLKKILFEFIPCVGGDGDKILLRQNFKCNKFILVTDVHLIKFMYMYSQYDNFLLFGHNFYLSATTFILLIFHIWFSYYLFVNNFLNYNSRIKVLSFLGRVVARAPISGFVILPQGCSKIQNF